MGLPTTTTTSSGAIWPFPQNITGMRWHTTQYESVRRTWRHVDAHLHTTNTPRPHRDRDSKTTTPCVEFEVAAGLAAGGLGQMGGDA